MGYRAIKHGAGGKKRDANEPPIVKALLSVGATVELLTIEDGPDLLVGFVGKNWLLEVKNRNARGQLKKGQKRWHQEWRGNVATVYDPIDALRTIGVSLKAVEA